MSSPAASRATAAGSSVSSRSRIVGCAAEVMSITRPSRIAATDGPRTSGRQTRTTKVPSFGIAMSPSPVFPMTSRADAKDHAPVAPAP